MLLSFGQEDLITIILWTPKLTIIHHLNIVHGLQLLILEANVLPATELETGH
jgi:hypothetical protein